MLRGGAPFHPDGKKGDVIDRNGVSVRLIGSTRSILHSLKTEDGVRKGEFWQGAIVTKY